MIRPNQPTETLTPEPLYEFSETPITDRDELARLNRTLRRHPPRSANWITWLAGFRRAGDRSRPRNFSLVEPASRCS